MVFNIVVLCEGWPDPIGPDLHVIVTVVSEIFRNICKPDLLGILGDIQLEVERTNSFQDLVFDQLSRLGLPLMSILVAVLQGLTALRNLVSNYPTFLWRAETISVICSLNLLVCNSLSKNNCENNPTSAQIRLNSEKFRYKIWISSA